MASGKYLKTKEQRLKIAFKMKENYLGRQLTDEEKSSYVFSAEILKPKKGIQYQGRSKGFIMSLDHRKKISEAMRRLFPQISKYFKENIRKTPEYKNWRQQVFLRDNYTCQICGYKSLGSKPSDIDADHIKPFALYPELRLNIENGRALCKLCHKATDTYLNGTRILARNLFLLSPKKV